MRISDWSSDVCSSDLLAVYNGASMQNKGLEGHVTGRLVNKANTKWDVGVQVATYRNKVLGLPDGAFETTYYGARMITEVGASRSEGASCRERVCQYV